MRDAVAIIPARLASSRFPEKVLANRTGRPLIEHVHERARRASRVARVVVAGDDERIGACVRAFGGGRGGGEFVLTRADHPNGTSRLREAAAILGLAPDAVVVNVQGDEPEVEPGHIDACVEALTSSGAPVATVACDPPASLARGEADPNVVKVVVRRDGTALYFSRATIPHPRDPAGPARLLRHVGLYAYRRSFLDTYASLEPTPLERTESLEQLRVLEHGYAIAVACVPGAAPAGIDTPEQYEAFVRRWNARPA